MEFEEEVLGDPVSPTGYYLTSSTLSVCIIGVMEFQLPINFDAVYSWVHDFFLPINSRFSSIMVEEKIGVKKWKRVNVNLKNHINTPIFPKIENPPHFYDLHFNNYISNLATSQLRQDQPLWEIHIIKYPTSTAAAHLIFKLHHALGDGYALMGALLSCLQRADNPSLPLTFPSLQSKLESRKNNRIRRFVERVPKGLIRCFNSLYNFGWEVLKSTILVDDVSPIRSNVEGVELKPMLICTTTFCLDRIKEIKNKLNVTVNDVIFGIITFGCRLYMKEMNHKSTKTHSTALLLTRTRNVDGYKSVSEMQNSNSNIPWGNNFAYMNVSIPKIRDKKISKPLEFIHQAHKEIKSKRNSASVYLSNQMVEALRKLRGHEVTARFIYGSLKNSSTIVSNVIGPVQQIALANNPIQGLYFSFFGVPQSITITILSYAGKMRIAFAMEKEFMDSKIFMSCIENSFEIMSKAALNISE